ncbi:TPA: hypothetical protein MAT86_001934 [Klebsiella aerogenes]|nr:hypothetical protein [Klebsiella aerogenes]
MDYPLPQLPEGYRYGADHSAQLPKEGQYFAPEGCIIKSIDTNTGQVIYVPVQRYFPEKNTWYTVNLNVK